MCVDVDVCVCVCVVVVEIFQNAMFDYQRLLAITNLYWTNNCYPIDVIPSHHPRSTDGLIFLGVLLKPVSPHLGQNHGFPVKIFPWIFPFSIRQVGMSKSKVFRSNVTMASSHGAAAFASRQRLDVNLPRDFPWTTEEKSVENRGNYGKSWEYHGRCQRMPGRGSFESRRWLSIAYRICRKKHRGNRRRKTWPMEILGFPAYHGTSD